MIHILKICVDGEESYHSWILSVGYFCTVLQMYSGLPRWCIGKEFTCQCRRRQRQILIPELRRSPGGGQPTPIFSPGKFHGQRSLMGYSPWGHKESDTTNRLTPTNTQWQHTPVFLPGKFHGQRSLMDYHPWGHK